MARTDQWRDNRALPEIDWRPLMEPVARRLSELGLIDPINRRLSTKSEWRCRSHGSLAISLSKGTWWDHESSEGGGVLDLVTHAIGGTKARAIEWLERNGLLTPSPPISGSQPHGTDDRRNRASVVRYVWSQTSPADQCVTTYLTKARGLSLDAGPPSTLRYLAPRPPRYPYPAMVAPFAIPQEPEPGMLATAPETIAGLHLTLLRHDGRGKADVEPNKRTIGSAMGVPIVVAPMNDNLGLAIAEGIENALSAHTATGLGAWAAGGAARMPALADAVPAYTDLVTVVADEGDAGQRNAHELAKRLVGRGIAVEIQTPSADVRAAA